MVLATYDEKVFRMLLQCFDSASVYLLVYIEGLEAFDESQHMPFDDDVYIVVSEIDLTVTGSSENVARKKIVTLDDLSAFRMDLPFYEYVYQYYELATDRPRNSIGWFNPEPGTAFRERVRANIKIPSYWMHGVITETKRWEGGLTQDDKYVPVLHQALVDSARKIERLVRGKMYFLPPNNRIDEMIWTLLDDNTD